MLNGAANMSQAKEHSPSADRIPNGEWVTLDADVAQKRTGQWHAIGVQVIGRRGDHYKVRDENGFTYRAHEDDLRRSRQETPASAAANCGACGQPNYLRRDNCDGCGYSLLFSSVSNLEESK
jgi:hypothetical protein